ncbi:hypothetical protein KI688_012002 [Linnemannia hyalina]|uniref:Uncharacterized protein n=1 Tax=Linnemannia hyalina TaxID=64524 RepID=A0A9P7XTW8_9FUNG|nr:hypothetical protein KI688_012002 [Linnemannia hyalina]
MTNPSEIESHPVETLKAQKEHHDAAHPSLEKTPLHVADHPLPPMAQAGLNAMSSHIGAGIATAGLIGVPHFPPKEDHAPTHHEHKHHDVHHESHAAAHDHHGNPQEPLKNKTLGFDAHQLPTM